MAACADAEMPETEMKEEETEEKMEQEDSGDSSGESDDEADEQLTALEQQVLSSPYQYDSHTLLIQKLRAAGELTRLQEARERMAAIFPLTAELWIEWIEDEKKVMQEDDRSSINAIFERAVKDYTTVELWLEYIQFSIGGMAAEGGMDAVRAVCEKAITATGLHVAKGCMIWEAYREYENAVLMGLQPMPGSVASATQQEQLTAQTKRLMTLFRRQLSVPLNNVMSTWEEFKDFAEEEDQEKVQPIYEKTLAKLDKLLPLEQGLSAADNLTAFEDYIDAELENGEPSRIQSIFERALVTHCLIPRLWIRYTQYLVIELKIPDLVLSVYERAVRNCPWSSELWCSYGRALERYSRSHSQTKDVFTRALMGGFTTGLEFLTVWNAHLDYLRRRVTWGKREGQEPSEEETELWETFDLAIQHLFETFSTEGDPEGTLLRYKARLKAKHVGDIATAREAWNDVMQAGHGNKAAMWLEYFNLERSYGDHKHARKILQRALNSANDSPESIVQAYIRFEREEGDAVDTYDTAVCRCEAQMTRIEERRAKAAEKEAAQDAQKKTVRKEKKAAKKVVDKQATTEQPKKKPTPNKGHPAAGMGAPVVFVRGKKAADTPIQPPTEVRPYKRKAETESPAKEVDGQPQESGEFKVPTSPAQPSPAKKKAPPPGYKGPKAPPPGYKAPTETAEEPPEKKPRVEEAESESTDKPFVVDASRECRTAFVSNLDFKSKEADVRKVLDEVGEITDFRLIKSFTGKSKGFAYVEFIDELLVEEAVKLDRTPINGRPMFISRCNERSNNAATFKYATTVEMNKLFVRGLPFSLTQDEVGELFAEHGKLKEVRLVTYRSGASKGLAYIDFEKEHDASQAVMKMDGHVIGEHTLNVAISNPPARKAPVSTGFTPALGGGKRDMGSRGRAGTQVTLMPRSLQRRPPDPPADANGEKPAAKMSNKDFRAMMLNK